MSKFLERIKQNKEKSIIIGIGLVVFIVGLVVTIVNTGDTYATSTGLGCYTCTGSSSLDSNNYWGLQPESSTCTGSWVSTSADSEDACLGYKVVIRYSVNGGEIDPSIVTDINGVTHNWQSLVMNGIHTIFDGGADYYQTIRYGKNLGSDGLANYNNEKFINITRDGYYVTSGKEWICIDGCTDENKVFSQSESYNSSAFCSAYSSNCSVTLGVNWQANNTYTIKYDANEGSGAPAEQSATVGTNVTISSTKPTRTGYTFKSWEIVTGGNEVNVSPGATQNFDNYISNNQVTLKAVWVVDSNAGSSTTTTYTIKYDANEGSGAPAEQSATVGTNVTISSTKPTRKGYDFVWWEEIDTGHVVIPGSTKNLDKYISNGKITLKAVWYINHLGIRFKPNANNVSIASPTGTEQNEWGFDNDKFITKNGSQYSMIIEYENTLGTDGLADYNYENWINMSRRGYSAPTDNEWICLEGCTDSNKTFSQSTVYSASDICNIDNGDCNIVLGVNWKPNMYTVSFDANGGNFTSDEDSEKYVTYDEKYGNLPTPTRDGYTFDGWYTSKTGENPITKDSIVNITDTQELYAHWSTEGSGSSTTPTNYTVNIKYSANNDDAIVSTVETSGGIWSKDASNFILKDGVKYEQTYNYNSPIADYGLMNPRSDRHMYITRTGYRPKPGAEWKCRGDCISQTYEQDYVYNANEICDASNSNCNVTLGVNWTKTKVHIQYNANGGLVRPETDGGTWKNVADIIYRDGTPIETIIKHGNSLEDGIGLLNSTNSANMYVTKEGYVPLEGAEWKCISGDCKDKTYDTDKSYSHSDFCNADNNDCTVVLEINWTEKTENPDTYKVTFNANGGNVSPSSKDVTYNDVYGELPKPTKAGYTFTGWYNQEEEGTKITETSKVTNNSNHTLYARWRINKISIKYSANMAGADNVKIESETTSDDQKTHTWKIENDLIYRDNNIYKTVIDYGESLTDSGLINSTYRKHMYVTSDNFVPIPEKEWICVEGDCLNDEFHNETAYAANEFCDATNGDCEVTLGINWMDVRYDIILDNQNATQSGTNKLYGRYNEGVYLDNSYSKKMSDNANGINVPSKNGATFDGYYTSPNGAGKQMITKDGKITGNYTSTMYVETPSVTWYANWKSSAYIITYDANGGSGAPNNQSKPHNASVTLSTVVPIREGYTFLGWDNNRNASSASYSAGATYENNGDVTLYAIWQANEYTISYNANGGNNEPSTQTKTHDINITLSNSIPEREGYEFLGWGTSPSQTTPTYTRGATYTNNASVVLYAIWKDSSGNIAPPIEVTYNITYDANGGTNVPAPETGNSITISSTRPNKIGYTFIGWNTSRDGSGTSYAPGAVYVGEPTATLYAQWQANTYNISINLNGGSLSGNPYEGTYDNIITIQNPTKTVTIHGNANGTDAFIGNDTSSVQEFAGWTSSTIDNTSAYYDNTAWTDGNVKVTATNFKNLTTVNGATVGLVANWNPTYITLPEVIKLGYTCNWNTKADGSGDKYLSGGQYLPSSDSAATINLYAECINNSNSDDEIDNPPKTGDILIVLAWIIGISSLGYSVYYLRSIKKD